jgi:hypothetical protein
MVEHMLDLPSEISASVFGTLQVARTANQSGVEFNS